MDVVRLQCLRTFDLSSNQLKEIPNIFKSMPRLEEIRLEGNPFEQAIEKDFWKISSAERIRGYLSDRTQGVKQWTEVKVLVLGQEVRSPSLLVPLPCFC
jgi:hypothetical protein